MANTLIVRLHQFLTVPATKYHSHQRRLWFSLSLAVAVIYGIIFLQRAFSSDYIIQDDARQHVFWMRRFLNGGLFPDDLIANYYQSQAPDGYFSLYRFIAEVGIDPVVFSKILPPILGIITTVYCFGCIVQMFPVPLAGFIGTLLLNHNLWIKDDIASGTSRAFFYPLLVAFLYYLMQRSLISIAIAIILQALFYPPGVLLSVGILFVRLWRYSQGKLKLSSQRSDYLCFAVGFGVAALGMLPTILQSSAFGSTIAASQARTMLEFSQNGRSSFFLDNPWEFWIFGQRSGFLPVEWKRMGENYCLLMSIVGLTLPILKRYPSRFPLIEQLNDKVFVLLQLFLVSLGLFLAAHAVLFKLYLPSRYSQHSLRVLMAMTAAIALTVILDAVFHACHQHSRSSIVPVLAIGFTTFLGILLLLSPFYWRSFLDVGYVTGQFPALYKFFQQQPEDSLIASIADEGRNLPSFAQRPVLTAREFAIPYHTGYYAQIRQRTIDLIDAQYTTDFQQVQEFVKKYGVDFWLLERSAFSPEYLAKNNKRPNRVWIRQYQPAADIALARLQNGIVPALAKVLLRCTAFEAGDFIVLKGDCLTTTSTVPDDS